MIAGRLEIGCKRSVAAPHNTELSLLSISCTPPLRRSDSLRPGRQPSLESHHTGQILLAADPTPETVCSALIHDAVLNGFLSGPGVHRVRERTAPGSGGNTGDVYLILLSAIFKSEPRV